MSCLSVDSLLEYLNGAVAAVGLHGHYGLAAIQQQPLPQKMSVLTLFFPHAPSSVIWRVSRFLLLIFARCGLDLSRLYLVLAGLLAVLDLHCSFPTVTEAR